MSQVNTNSIYDASGGSNAVLYGVAAPANSMGFRNRIINGDMRIDQRNAGASVSITTDAKNYVMDRFWAYDSTDGAFSLQQVTDAPAGFVNSAKITITTADASVGADQYAGFSQLIEGTNSYDLAWGTASAKAVTLSFWVRSSVTGTFGGSLRNNAADRSYPFSYSISVADTWEYKTITIAGDTSGTWLTTTGIGIRVNWSIADGSNRVGTAGAWAGANYAGATGQTQLISTLNATFYITGVQLEAGSVASPFERRDYGRELIMCQRYLPIGQSASGPAALISWNTASTFQGYFVFKTTPRVAPTGVTISSASHFLANYPNTANPTVTGITFSSASTDCGFFTGTVASGGGPTAGLSGYLIYNNASAQIQFTGCEL